MSSDGIGSPDVPFVTQENSSVRMKPRVLGAVYVMILLSRELWQEVGYTGSRADCKGTCQLLQLAPHDLN